ncbi:MAG: glycoside hydrolase family 2 protein [Eubacteriales bacterium]
MINLTKWKLNSYFPYVPLLLNSLETGAEIMASSDWIDAEVPGSIYKDLLKAGHIDNPYFELNSLKCEWVADRWWMYKCSFIIPREYDKRNLRLNLSGVDYKAHISLNGVKLGDHEGMFIPFLYEISPIVRFDEENELIVLLEHAPDEMGQIGYTSKTFTQKSRFTYRWDFCARLIHLGLYDKAFIEDFGTARIDYSHIRTISSSDGRYDVSCKLDITGYTAGQVDIDYALTFEGEIIDTVRQHINIGEGLNSTSCNIKVDNSRLWYPSGHGEQPLYDLSVRIYDKDGLSDCKAYKVGIRTISFCKCEQSPNDALDYRVIINGKSIFLKGINLAPLDQIYGGLTYENYNSILTAVKEGNFNFLRVNGVGFIESESFYELCDKYGIMVWQDFIQSSSGIDNSPSCDVKYLELLSKVSTYAVKTRRNHVSLTMWCGGNELREVYNTQDPPATYNNENIRLLDDIVKKYDPDRIMMPTTASGPNEFLNPVNKGKNHDVHGPWKFNGPVEHYTIYNDSDALFHSEFGTDGMTNYSSLTRFLSDEHIKVQPFSSSRVWKNHGDWWCTYGRDIDLFGHFEESDIHAFIKCSQFIQAEALRYSYEANRRRMFKCCGSMAWQLNEPWPNVSNTCLIDYYGGKKLAYYYVKDSLENIKPTLKYDKLIWEKNEVFNAEIHLVNECIQRAIDVDCEIYDKNDTLIISKRFDATVPFNSSVKIGDINCSLCGLDIAIKVKLKLDGVNCKTDYILFIDNVDLSSRKSYVTTYYDDFMRLMQ